MWILDWLFGDPVTPEWLTVTLPITLTGAKVLLAMLGLILSSGLVWLMLNAPDRAERRRDLLTDALTALGWVLLPFWFLLLAGTLWHLWLLFSGLDSFLDNVGFGMGAVVAAFLGGPFVIWGAVLKHRTVEFQKEGHITERISKAVEQLGAEKSVKRDGKPEETVPNIEVRIGGLLSLERIAQDSTNYDKGRDHVRVMEILCAYVRENAPAEDAVDFPLPEWEPLKDDATEEERENHVKKREDRFEGENGSKAQEWAQSLPDPRADIALALRIIGRRDKEQLRVEARWGPEASDKAEWVFDTPCPYLPEPPEGKRHPEGAIKSYKQKLQDWNGKISGYSGYRPDLRKTNLQKADLSKLTLSGVRLDAARMEGAFLGEARMEGADLGQARMEGADLRRVRMEGADLWGARMEGAFFGEARLEGTDLGEARMEGAFLGEARMEGAFLWGARMEGAFLGEARMEGAFLWRARMEGAFLGEARLSTSFSAVASLTATALKEVDLSRIDLSQEQVNAMFGDGSVTLPEGVAWPKKWPAWVLPFLGEHAFRDEWRKWQADPERYEPPEPPDDAAEQPAE
ncbi:pentapeptide repeat-containing protein [Mameliella sp. CS4]|uniref:pentapeptide repeat-containing protein n=1 Tax=Mameliella sp. CS4 TaxID=2862329 RepID=UPI001C5DF6C2|nr:pentapeptide repeat-containing protein [Mameliella sp. CS4]MBW4982992.1 pentapeptide repeat-containing protein [Mameliella sp. CS4]